MGTGEDGGPVHLHTYGVGVEFWWLDAPVVVPEVDKEFRIKTCWKMELC
jgi:hypothetical protein